VISAKYNQILNPVIFYKSWQPWGGKKSCLDWIFLSSS